MDANNTVFNQRHGMVGKKMAWCQMAVACWFKDAGVDGYWGAWTPSGIQWFRDRRAWTKGVSGIRAGDVIYFKMGSNEFETDHVGVVEYVDGSGAIHTIEGNRSDRVARFQYLPGDRQLVGYGRPTYDGGGEPGPNPGIQTVDLHALRVALDAAKKTVVKRGSRGDAVKWVQNLLNKHKAAGLSVDGAFEQLTEDAVKRFQEDINGWFGKKVLEVDGKVGPDTWFWLDR